MKWLLWKDYRHNRLIVVAALALLMVPYLVGFGVIVGGRWVKNGVSSNGQVDYWVPPWKSILAGSSLYSLAISQITFALIGGNAISGERVDRSSEFLYSLPLRRTKLFASKLLFALAIAATVWLVNVAVLWCFVNAVPELQARSNDLLVGVANIAATGLLFFCVAWFLSSMIGSPAFDVCGGVVAPLFVISGILLIDWMFWMAGLSERRVSDSDWSVQMWYWGICLTLAPLCFAIGTWHYLRRVEP
jgi:ABC-type transport system involved in multi-copper enzyme maturation permease subunit